MIIIIIIIIVMKLSLSYFFSSVWGKWICHLVISLINILCVRRLCALLSLYCGEAVSHVRIRILNEEGILIHIFPIFFSAFSLNGSFFFLKLLIARGTAISHKLINFAVLPAIQITDYHVFILFVNGMFPCPS